MTRTCLYTRISTDEENQPTSLASQHERLEAFCKVQEDWRIIAHHEDRATGTKLDRPGLQAALDLARQGRIDQLLVYRIDRLIAQGAPARGDRRGTRQARRDPALRHRAIRHRLSGGTDDAADARGVRRVRARNDR